MRVAATEASTRLVSLIDSAGGGSSSTIVTIPSGSAIVSDSGAWITSASVWSSSSVASLTAPTGIAAVDAPAGIVRRPAVWGKSAADALLDSAWNSTAVARPLGPLSVNGTATGSLASPTATSPTEIVGGYRRDRRRS